MKLRKTCSTTIEPRQGDPRRELVPGGSYLWSPDLFRKRVQYVNMDDKRTDSPWRFILYCAAASGLQDNLLAAISTDVLFYTKRALIHNVAW